MVLPINYNVIVLMPESIDKVEGCSYFDTMHLGSTKHHFRCGYVTSNLQRNSVINRSTWVDVEFGFSTGNFGCKTTINGTTNIISITWSFKYGVQVWKEGSDFQLSENFNNRKN